MKEQKIIYLRNEAELEEQIFAALNELDLEEASQLLQELEIKETSLEHTYIQDIKERTYKKLMMEDMIFMRHDKDAEEMKKENPQKRNAIRWKGYLTCAAVIIIVILAGFKHDSIVLAFQEMLSLIPGVGIVDSNQGAEYRLKEQVSAKNDQCSLKVLYVTATEDTMTVRFDLEGSLKEEQKLTQENKEEIYNIDAFLLVNNQKVQKTYGGGGAGLSGYQFSYNGFYTFELDKKLINTKKKYTLVCEEFDIRVSFRLSNIDQYNSLSDIGATQTHNDISLTASAFRKDEQLSVNVYPINNSNYNLISFNQEFDVEYFGKKMTLNTSKGIKSYTPPSYYGTGLNAPFLFDVSDGSSDFVLSIPFLVVEAEEEKEILLPIPEAGEIVEVNKEVKFENGSAIIKNVKRLAGDIGNEFGYLEIFLEYVSPNEKQQLVSVEFFGKDAIGFYPYYDDQHRTIAVSYMLKESDLKELKLSVTKPRYVLMEPYQLEIKDKH